jgi:hypothetical protein
MIRKGTSELFPQTASRAPRVALVPAIDEDWSDMPRGGCCLIRQSFPAITTLSWFV